MPPSPLFRPISAAILLGLALVACAPAAAPPAAPARAPATSPSPSGPPEPAVDPPKPTTSATGPSAAPTGSAFFVDAFGQPVHRRAEDAKCAEDELWDPAATACRWFPGGGYGAAGCSMGGGGISPKACVTGATFTGCDCTCKKGTLFDGVLRRCR